MRLLTILTLTLLYSMTAHADQKIDIQVNGMVCDFCAQAVWKVFEDYESVENVDINLDTGIVSVTLKEGQILSDEDLNKAIQYAGYDLVEVKRHEQ